MTRAHIVSVVLLALSAVAGCQAESFDRINEDGISFAALDSWAMHRERGSVVLSGGPAGFDKTRIVVRAVDVPQSQRNQTRRSPRRVFDATKQVLALPMQAPWGSLKWALDAAIALKPQKVIPVHDWHWRDEAADALHKMSYQILAGHGIEFIFAKNGKAFSV